MSTLRYRQWHVLHSRLIAGDVAFFQNLAETRGFNSLTARQWMLDSLEDLQICWTPKLAAAFCNYLRLTGNFFAAFSLLASQNTTFHSAVLKSFLQDSSYVEEEHRRLLLLAAARVFQTAIDDIDPLCQMFCDSLRTGDYSTFQEQLREPFDHKIIPECYVVLAFLGEMEKLRQFDASLGNALYDVGSLRALYPAWKFFVSLDHFLSRLDASRLSELLQGFQYSELDRKHFELLLAKAAIFDQTTEPTQEVYVPLQRQYLKHTDSGLQLQRLVELCQVEPIRALRCLTTTAMTDTRFVADCVTALERLDSQLQANDLEELPFIPPAPFQKLLAVLTTLAVTLEDRELVSKLKTRPVFFSARLAESNDQVSWKTLRSFVSCYQEDITFSALFLSHLLATGNFSEALEIFPENVSRQLILGAIQSRALCSSELEELLSYDHPVIEALYSDQNTFQRLVDTLARDQPPGSPVSAEAPLFSDSVLRRLTRHATSTQILLDWALSSRNYEKALRVLEFTPAGFFNATSQTLTIFSSFSKILEVSAVWYRHPIGTGQVQALFDRLTEIAQEAFYTSDWLRSTPVHVECLLDRLESVNWFSSHAKQVLEYCCFGTEKYPRTFLVSEVKPEVLQQLSVLLRVPVAELQLEQRTAAMLASTPEMCNSADFHALRESLRARVSPSGSSRRL